MEMHAVRGNANKTFLSLSLWRTILDWETHRHTRNLVSGTWTMRGGGGDQWGTPGRTEISRGRGTNARAFQISGEMKFLAFTPMLKTGWEGGCVPLYPVQLQFLKRRGRGNVPRICDFLKDGILEYAKLAFRLIFQ